MTKKKGTLIISILIMVIASGFLLPSLTQAAEVQYLTPVKDTDFDGLTDQGEIQVFKTDPQNPDSDNDGYLDGAEVLSGTDPLDSSDPVQTRTEELTNQALVQFIEESKVPWPWYFSRASGIAAYLLLFLLIVSGIGIKTSLSFRLLEPTTAWVSHRLIALSLTFAIAIHLVSLLFDEFLKFTVVDLLVPFSSSFEPLYVGLGIIGFYIFLAVIISSLFFIHKTPKIWRLLHYLTYPVFILIFLHGILVGTDTFTNIMQNIYWSTGIIVGILTVYRLYISYKQRD
jgi:DMSO/TMAO reductase YedYZ heme-binding membrane subunit